MAIFHFPWLLLTNSSTNSPSVRKAFVLGSNYALIPRKLVAKITSDVFVELANLVAENLHV